MHARPVTAMAIAIILLSGAIGIPGVLAEDRNDASSLDISNSSGAVPMTLALDSHAFYPNDTVHIRVDNAVEPMVSVLDPSSVVHAVPMQRVNGTAFAGSYVLNTGIILANYTVSVIDNATGERALDTFEVALRPVRAAPVNNSMHDQPVDDRPLYLYTNLSKRDYSPGEDVGITVTTNAGLPTVTIGDPVNNSLQIPMESISNDTYSGVFSLNRSVILGNYTVTASVNEAGVYDRTTAGFSVAANTTAAPADTVSVEYAAYDPLMRAIVLRADVSVSSLDDVEGAVKNSPALAGLTIKGVHITPIGDSKKSLKALNKKAEVLIPVDDNNSGYVTGRFNVSRDIVNATTSVSSESNGTELHISLNNKTDGYWYRMSASIPEGYTVSRITRADGKEIENDIEVNNSSGEIVKNDVNWYVDSGTLYFYDDPANTYTVSLSASPTTVTLYFHDNGAGYLNTSSNNASNDHTDFNSSKSAIWTQSKALASNFTIQSDPLVALYLTSSVNGQTLIDVTLSYTDGNTTTTIGNTITYKFTFTSGTPVPVVIDITGANNTTIPQGNKFQITINSHNNKVSTLYESTQYPSRIDLTSSNYIHVSNVAIYDTMGNPINSTVSPSTVKVVANVTDPFGTQDISSVILTMNYANGSTAIGPLSMSMNNTTIPPSNAWALFEAYLPISANQGTGNYTMAVTVTSLGGLTDSNSTPLQTASAQSCITATKSIASIGANGFTITFKVTNNLGSTISGVRAYDFYAADFTVSGFNQPRTGLSVNNAVLQGNINVFGPFTLAPYQTVTITYTAQGIGDYRLSDMAIVGVDPPA